MRTLLFVAFFALVPTVASAESALTFEEALALSDESPDVRGAKRALEVRRREDREISRVTQPTEFQLMPGYRVRSEQDRGFEGQAGISQGFSLAGLGRVQKRAARDEREALEAEARALSLERRLGTARAWLELYVLEQQVALADEEYRTARELSARVTRAAEAGVLTSADAADARSFAGEAELRLLSAEAQRLAGALALSASMGREPDENLRTKGGPPELSLPEDAALAAELSNVRELPRVAAARLEAVAARAREVEISAAHGPTLSTGVVLQREAPDGVMVFGQLTLGLPLANLGARERSRALAQAELHNAEHDARILSAMREAIAIAHEVTHAREEHRVLSQNIVPALDELAKSREKLLSAAEATVFEVLEARRRLVAARARLVQAQGALRWAEVRAWLWLAVKSMAASGSKEEGTR